MKVCPLCQWSKLLHKGKKREKDHKGHSRQEAAVTVCCAVTLREGRHRSSHCDSLQGLSPRSPWMTCLPTYLAGREVFGAGGGVGVQI